MGAWLLRACRVCGSLARAWASPPTVLVNLQPGSLEGHVRLGRANIFSSATLQGLVASLVHGRQRWELHSWSGCIWGSARPTVRLRALLTYSLPLVLTFLSPQPAGRVLREPRARSEGGRTGVVEALRRLSVELQQPLRGSGWDVDAGFQVVGVASPTTGAIVGGFPQNFLRSHLAAVTQFPLQILLHRRGVGLGLGRGRGALPLQCTQASDSGHLPQRAAMAGSEPS